MNANIIMAMQTLQETLKKLRHKNTNQELQQIATNINRDTLLGSTISNRLQEQINSVVLVSTDFAYDECKKKNKQFFKQQMKNGFNLSIMINKGSESIFKPLSKPLLLNNVKQLSGILENLGNSSKKINLHNIFFD